LKPLFDFVITYLREILEDGERTIASYGLWDAHQLLVHENHDAANNYRYKREPFVTLEILRNPITPPPHTPGAFERRVSWL